MNKIFQKIKKWWDETPNSLEEDLENLAKELKKEREERHARFEKMSERELLVEIAKALTD